MSDDHRAAVPISHRHRLIDPTPRADHHTVRTDLRAMVECLLTAHYSESEIIDYLTGPLGLADEDAIKAVRDVSGAGRYTVGAGGDCAIA